MNSIEHKTHLVVKFRYDTHSDIDILAGAFNRFVTQDGKIPIHVQSCGKHNATAKGHPEHFHYHIILKIEEIPKHLSNPTYYWSGSQNKNDYCKKNGVPIEKGKGAVSVSWLTTDDDYPDIETNINRALRYVYKDKQPVYEFSSLDNETIEGMMNSASQECKFADEQTSKRINNGIVKITKWNELLEYLETEKINNGLQYEEGLIDPARVWIKIQQYMYKNDTIPPSSDVIKKATDRYMVNYGLTKEQLRKFAEKQMNHFNY